MSAIEHLRIPAYLACSSGAAVAAFCNGGGHSSVMAKEEVACEGARNRASSPARARSSQPYLCNSQSATGTGSCMFGKKRGTAFYLIQDPGPLCRIKKCYHDDPRRKGPEICSLCAVGQWNISANRNNNSVLVGAVAVSGPGGTDLNLLERGEATGNRADQSLISAELVTEGNSMDPADLREMLRSELQAELQNNIVQAEVLPPAPAPAPLDPVPPAFGESKQPSSTKKRFYIVGALFVLIVGAAAGAGGALAAGGNDGHPSNADTVGSPGSQNTTSPFPPSISPLSPSATSVFEPTLQPSAGENQVNPMPTAVPTLSPTNRPTTKPPTGAGETWPPTRPTPWPTTLKPTVPTMPPTRPPTETNPTASPTRPPTRSPTYSPTNPPTAPPTMQTVSCPTASDPVCGSDGQTYSNACEAGLQGVSIVSQGSCPAPTASPTVGDICIRDYEPVCGDDGTTYSNACLAEVAGVSVASNGPCQEPTAAPTARPTIQVTDPPTATPAAGKTDPPTKSPTKDPNKQPTPLVEEEPTKGGYYA